MRVRHFLRCLPGLMVLGLLNGVDVSGGEPAPQARQPRFDAHGDPLPDGALFRLGSTRLHHVGEVSDLRLSPDGRSVTAISAPAALAITWDLATGKELHRVDLEVGQQRLRYCRFSANGDRILAASPFGGVSLFSAKDGKLITTRQGMFATAALSPDGKQISLVDRKAKIKHIETGTGLVLKEVTLEVKDAKAQLLQGFFQDLPFGGVAMFSPDGRRLAAYSFNSGLHVWDAQTGKLLDVLREKTMKVRGAAFSPDGRFVAVAFQAGFRLDLSQRLGPPIIIWDLTAAKQVQRLQVVYPHEIGAYPSDIRLRETLQFTPDGRGLAYIQQFIDANSVWFWDVKSGKLRQRLDTFRRPPRSLVFSPDGKTLAAGAWSGAVLVWELDSGKILGHPKGLPEVFEGALRFADGGKRLLVSYWAAPSQETQGMVIGTWDLAAGRKVQSTSGKALADLSADGRFLACYDPRGRTQRETVYVVDRSTGATRWQSSELSSSLRFSNDGTRLAHIGSALRVFDTQSGKELARFASKEPKELNDSDVLSKVSAISTDLRFVVQGDSNEGKLRCLDVLGGRQQWEASEVPTARFRGWNTAFSPDSKLLALTTSQDLFVWETSTGKKILQQKTGNRLLGFLPDSKTLVLDTSGGVQLWRTDRRRPGRKFAGGIDRTYSRMLALGGLSNRRGLGGLDSLSSPDSKILVTWGGEHAVQVWEVATSKLLWRVDADQEIAGAPTLSPDCRSLVTPNADGTITVWDLTGFRLAEQTQAMPLSAEEFEHCWDSLADGTKGDNSFRAFWNLAADPEQTVSRLRPRLKPAIATDAARLKQWIQDLDSKEFAPRARATKQLENDESAVPLLRQALDKQRDLELRQRITKILDNLEAGPEGSPAALRSYRLVQLLEQLRTPSAVERLQVLARGADAAMLTTEARASLARLGLGFH